MLANVPLRGMGWGGCSELTRGKESLGKSHQISSFPLSKCVVLPLLGLVLPLNSAPFPLARCYHCGAVFLKLPPRTTGGRGRIHVFPGCSQSAAPASQLRAEWSEEGRALVSSLPQAACSSLWNSPGDAQASVSCIFQLSPEEADSAGRPGKGGTVHLFTVWCSRSPFTDSSEDFKRCPEMVCNGNHCWIPPPVSWCACACARVCVCTQTQSKCSLVPHLLPWCRCESLSSPGLQSVGKDLLDCWKRLTNQGWRLWISNSHSCECRQQEEQARREGEDAQWITHARGRRVLHLTPGATGVFELFFTVRRCPVPCGIFGSMPGLHPNIPPWESHDNQNCPWLSPGGEITPGWEPWD